MYEKFPGTCQYFQKNVVWQCSLDNYVLEELLNSGGHMGKGNVGQNLNRPGMQI
jgi:hypothetical protein